MNSAYVVAGLIISSEIELPELLPCPQDGGEPDVEIRLAPVPAGLPLAVQATSEAEIADNEVLLKIPGVARYLISGGRQIRIEAETGVGAQEVRLFLLGSALGAIYFQRGYLPLHASVVVINGSAVAFAGDSGAGKSTMAAWLNAAGYPLLCDDVCVVRFAEHEIAMAYPGYPRVKLWSDALQEFEIDPRALQRDYFRADKFHVPVPERFWIDPVPLRHINVLQFSAAATQPRIAEVSPTNAVVLLRDNTYRYQFISGLGLTRQHFLDCVRLARRTNVHILIRQERHSALAECQALIERQMQ